MVAAPHRVLDRGSLLPPVCTQALRHLHFTQSLEPLQGGGLGSSSLALHRHMLATGVESTLYSTYGGRPQVGGKEIHECKRIKPECLYFSPELDRRAAEWVASADILHGHGLYVGTNYVFGREARRQRKPLVYHAHGFFEPWILNRSRWKKRLAHWFFEDQNFRQARFWRALTPKEAEQIKELGIKTPIAVVPNGVEAGDFPAPTDPNVPVHTPLIPRLNKTRPRVLFMSRIHPKKGLDLLIPAWSNLDKSRRDWELVVAGPDEGGYLSCVRSLTDSFQLTREVQFTGAVTGETRNALLHSADVFVLPSYSEGFSMAILEAMACGVPVLATRSCNFPDITRHEAGWECDPSLDSLTNTLRQALAASHQERKERGSLARRLVEQRYTWPAILKDLFAACAAYC